MADFIPYAELPDRVKALVDDSRVGVRAVAAQFGLGSDKLLNDNDLSVHRAIAEQGLFLDVLINHPVYEVRAAVAQHGYGLDKLIYDEIFLVRYAASNALRESGCVNILSWIKANPDKCALPENQKRGVIVADKQTSLQGETHATQEASKALADVGGYDDHSDAPR